MIWASDRINSPLPAISGRPRGAGAGPSRLDRTDKPEFDRWCWVNYWKPLEEVVSFKRNVYWQALRELSTLLFSEGLVLPEPPRRRRNRRSSELSGRRGLPGNRAGSRRGRVPRG